MQDKLLDMGLSLFLDMTTKGQATTVKINKQDYIKLKSFFCMARETSKMKHSPWFWKKIYTNHISQQRQCIFAKKVDRRYSQNNKKGDGYVIQIDYNNHLTKYYISNHPTLHLKIYTISVIQYKTYVNNNLRLFLIKET